MHAEAEAAAIDADAAAATAAKSEAGKNWKPYLHRLRQHLHKYVVNMEALGTHVVCTIWLWTKK